MKSGPTLKGWTVSPRRWSEAMRPSVTVVLPTPLCVPPTTIALSGLSLIADAGLAKGPKLA